MTDLDADTKRAREFWNKWANEAMSHLEWEDDEDFSASMTSMLIAFAKSESEFAFSSPAASSEGSGESSTSRIWHMYVWTKQPFFHAVAQAENVAEARELLLEEIGGGDGSCPEREAAAKWVKEQQPTIFHCSNAEFSLTDSTELREQEAYVEQLQKEIKSLREAGESSDELRSLRAWKKSAMKQLARAEAFETCICGDGFGMNLSCPIHSPAPAPQAEKDEK